MKKNLFKRGMAGLLSLVMCLTALVGLGTTTAFAAGEQAEVYLISFPRSGDANLDYGGSWGHPNLQYTQNVDDLLQSHTARTMLANSEFIIMLNQASTDRIELAKLLNISDTQLSYITNVDAGHGLIKVGSSLVPFANKFPKNTKLYKLMTTKLSDIAN